jgi:uncharacterized pyridoxal phosphate-containing UPF0001 family protein
MSLSSVLSTLTTACKQANRAREEVTLIAVSKTHPSEAILPLLEAGQRHFGENRVQEAYAKWPELKARYPDTTLHLIGPLQTNKAKEAVALFDVIHTLDREKLAKILHNYHSERLDRREQERRISAPQHEILRFAQDDRKGAQDDSDFPNLFIQINTGEEPQKAGISPLEADDFITYCRNDLNLPILGLMCIPPAEEEPAYHFALLKTIADRHGLTGLSMGMSGDYPTAIALGATHIRVGTAVFGKRE